MAQYVYTMNRVGKVVPPKKTILENISLSFFPGAKIGVLGLNGSGKSTLLRIMAGLDTDILGEARPQPGIKIGYLPQEPQLNPDKDVRGNVEEGLQEAVDALAGLQQVYADYADPDADFDALSKEQARLEDIIEAANFDFDAVESNLGYVNVLLKEMRALRASMTDGSYQFGRRDLPWMRIVKQHSDFVSYPITMEVERDEPLPDALVMGCSEYSDTPLGIVREHGKGRTVLFNCAPLEHLRERRGASAGESTQKFFGEVFARAGIGAELTVRRAGGGRLRGVALVWLADPLNMRGRKRQDKRGPALPLRACVSSFSALVISSD